MKKTFLTGAICAFCSIFFTACGLSAGAESSSEAADGNGTQVTGGRHFERLDRVRIPGSIPAQEKQYTGFYVSFNKDNRTPNWVAWELLGSEAESEEVSRKGYDFFRDMEIDGCPEGSDYKRSGYDRGHMCPAADQKWSAGAMADCFVMANMCPQDHSLNSGAWSTLEKKERQWASRDSAIIIVAGPIYDKSDTNRVGPGNVRVPGAFFKVIAAPYAESPRGIAFVYPNMSSPGDMRKYSMSIDELENITGYDFLYELPDEIEEAIESKASFNDWSR